MVILICAFVVWVSKGCARMNNDMVHIDDNYSYDKETHIIYQESWNWFTRTLQFRPYYDDNGNLYKFDEATNTWTIIE